MRARDPLVSLELYDRVKDAVYSALFRVDGGREVNVLKEASGPVEFDTITLNNSTDCPPSWKILSNPMESSGSVADPQVFGNNGCKMPSCDVTTMSLIAPSSEMFNGVLNTISQLPLPSYVSWSDKPRNHIGAQRWQFTSANTVPVVKDEIILTCATIVLFAMIEKIASMALANQLPMGFISSWHLTGIRGTGKSTSLLVCACGLFAEPDKYRVVYIPNASYADPECSALDMFRRYLYFAFLGDPILTFISNFQGAPREDGFSFMSKYLQVINNFLMSRKLFLVIIVDQLDLATEHTNSAMSYFPKHLKNAVFRSNLKNILLITAATPNNEYAEHRCVLRLDLLTGFNKKEAELFARNFVDSEEFVDLMIRDLGVRPIDLNFNLSIDGNQLTQKPTNLSVTDIKKRGKELVAEIAKNLEQQLKITEHDCMLIGGISRIVAVLEDKVGERYARRIDNRFMKWIWIPENSNVEFGDITGFELALCDASFRDAMKNGNQALYILTAHDMVRAACVDIFRSFTFKRTQVNQYGKLLDDEQYFKQLFVNDLIFPTGRKSKKLTIQKYLITDNCISSTNAQFEMDLGVKIKYISSDLAIVAKDRFELHHNVSQRLRETLFAADIYLFECRPQYKAVDFVLIRHVEPYFIKMAFGKDLNGLLVMMLQALSTLEAKGEELFPILLKGVEPRKINFVFFSSLPPFRGPVYEPNPNATNIKRLMMELSAKSNSINLFLMSLEANKDVLCLCQMLAEKRGLTSPSRDD